MANKKMRGTHESVDTFDKNTHYRQCVFCGEVKELDMFPKNGVDEHGNTKRRLDCKTCYNIRRRENRTKKRHSDFVGGMKRRGEAAPQLSHQEWKECVIFFSGTCCYCGKTMRKGERLTRDHLDAIANGGNTTQANIVPACTRCNSSKGASEWKAWYMKQSFFSQDRMNEIFKWRSIMRLLEGSNIRSQRGSE